MTHRFYATNDDQVPGTVAADERVTHSRAGHGHHCWTQAREKVLPTQPRLRCMSEPRPATGDGYDSYQEKSDWADRDSYDS